MTTACKIMRAPPWVKTYHRSQAEDNDLDAACSERMMTHVYPLHSSVISEDCSRLSPEFIQRSSGSSTMDRRVAIESGAVQDPLPPLFLDQLLVCLTQLVRDMSWLWCQQAENIEAHSKTSYLRCTLTARIMRIRVTQ